MSKRKYELTKHHIIPSSRGGSSKLENICYVPRVEHEKYHALFENQTPEEIIKYLNSKFWKNNYKIDIYKSRE
ncbi:MAG: HNH endonuclease [Promethearchaeia archaeon]